MGKDDALIGFFAAIELDDVTLSIDEVEVAAWQCIAFFGEAARTVVVQRAVLRQVG